MTQLHLPATLADRVRAWASTRERATFADLCDAMSESATDVDAAATEAGVLHWDGAGFYVGRPVAP